MSARRIRVILQESGLHSQIIEQKVENAHDNPEKKKEDGYDDGAYETIHDQELRELRQYEEEYRKENPEWNKKGEI